MNELVEPLSELKPESISWLWPNNLSFLQEFLQGTRPTTEIWPTAQRLGFSRSTFRRARKRCRIRFIRSWSGKKSVVHWLLPAKSFPAIQPTRLSPTSKNLAAAHRSVSRHADRRLTG